MGKIIVIANQKGGVGKTTTAVNLAASLVALEQSVLLIDLDPQGNATTGSGINKQDLATSSMEVLLGETDTASAILPTVAGYSVIPANSDLTVAEVTLLQMEQREQRLANQLIAVRNQYDFILIDCPPSLNMLTVNALVAANSVIIPMQCEYYALEGLSGLLDTIENLRASVNPNLEIEGILRTLFDGRNSLSKQVSDELLAHFNDKVYDTIIPRNVRLAEAPSHGQPVLMYDVASSGSTAYMALAQELLAKQNSNLSDLTENTVVTEESIPKLHKRSESDFAD